MLADGRAQDSKPALWASGANPSEVKLHLVIMRYESEVRELLRKPGRALEVRSWRLDEKGTWRHVGEECQARWRTAVGTGDTQSLGATLCHVAAELLGEDPDAEPWN